MEPTAIAEIRRLIAKAKRWDLVFSLLGLLALLIAVMVLVGLFMNLLWEGAPRISWEFFTNFSSRRATNAGIAAAWVGTLLVMLVTALTAVPLGVAAGVYLEEYAPKNWLTGLIEINISNLAGVLKDQARYPEAIEFYEAAIAASPGEAYIHSNLGDALREAGREPRLSSAISAIGVAAKK